MSNLKFEIISSVRTTLEILLKIYKIHGWLNVRKKIQKSRKSIKLSGLITRINNLTAPFILMVQSNRSWTPRKKTHR